VRELFSVNRKGRLEINLDCPLQKRQTQKGDRSIELPIFNPLARKRWMVRASPRPLYYWEENTVPFVQETWRSMIIQI